MFSVLLWGRDWMLFMHRWSCPISLIHLIHFEKNNRKDFNSIFLSLTAIWAYKEFVIQWCICRSACLSVYLSVRLSVCSSELKSKWSCLLRTSTFLSYFFHLCKFRRKLFKLNRLTPLLWDLCPLQICVVCGSLACEVFFHFPIVFGKKCIWHDFYLWPSGVDGHFEIGDPSLWKFLDPPLLCMDVWCMKKGRSNRWIKPTWASNLQQSSQYCDGEEIHMREKMNP